MPGHIVALGGGGFSMEPENPALDDFILSLSRRKPGLKAIAAIREFLEEAEHLAKDEGWL